jgi:hypothetical protein
MLALALAGCGGGSRSTPRSTPSAAQPPAPAQVPRPAFGVTEDNANLLWAPGARAPATAEAFLGARRELSALHPAYVRLLVQWAALQPSASAPPDLAAAADGCARGAPPCGAYAGIAAELEAVASEQRAARAEGRNPPQVVLDIFDAPSWAALAPHGCERPGTPASARPIAPTALDAYRRLIDSLLALGRQEGVALPWWSPWNEPNDPRFLSPQRASCARSAAPVAVAVYATLAQALSRELSAQAPQDHLLLGELGGYTSGSPHRIGVAEFVAALPREVLCLAGAWSVHSYATWGSGGAAGDPVPTLEDALTSRGGCAAAMPVWVTETGAGAPAPGRPRSGGSAEQRAGCLALARLLEGWRADPRVAVVVQYELRDDPAFPVGLIDPSLTGSYDTYELWRHREGPAPAAACGG